MDLKEEILEKHLLPIFNSHQDLSEAMNNKYAEIYTAMEEYHQAKLKELNTQSIVTGYDKEDLEDKLADFTAGKKALIDNIVFIDFDDALNFFIQYLSSTQPTKEVGKDENKQPFENYPELSKIIETIASVGTSYLNNTSNWSKFLREINNAIQSTPLNKNKDREVADWNKDKVILLLDWMMQKGFQAISDDWKTEHQDYTSEMAIDEFEFIEKHKQK